MAIPAEIQALATKVRNEVYGRDVREAIAKSIEETGKTAAEAYEITQNLIDGTFDEGILSTQIEQKLLNLEAQYAPQLTSLTAELADIAVSSKSFGLDENATWQTNRDALQQANDAVFALGGGRVLIPPGRYLVKGVIQDSRVEFYGKGATLVHPDGLTLDIFKARVYSTTGSTVAGSQALTVSSTANIEEGTVLGIQGAGGMSPLQFTTITTEITNTQTEGITLTDTTGFATSGFLVVESEIIRHTGRSGNVLTGVTRGVLGTVPTSHIALTKIGTAMRLMAEVLSVEGNTVTMDTPAKLAVTGASVHAGILFPAITDVTLDGQRIVGQATSGNAVTWEMVRWGKPNFTAKNANAAFFLGRGARDNAGTVFARDCGNPELKMGSAIWLFQHCHRNNIDANITGEMWSGVYLDNRTSLATEWDGSCNDNIGDIIVKADKYDSSLTTVGLLIVGSDRNDYRINCTNVRTGFTIHDVDQVHTSDGSLPTARGNHVNLRMSNGYQPWIISCAGNTVIAHGENFLGNGVTAEGNLILAYSNQVSAPKLPKVEGGTQTAPGMSFANDLNTGFYNIAPGQMQFVSQSGLVMRFNSSGLQLSPGKHLITDNSMIGTSAGVKMGFWGATPISRPSGTPPAANDLASALTLVNFLRTALQNSGLININ